jgi:D-glycero-D-manno-heptose 1,7-bisphosphate phosphatase
MENKAVFLDRDGVLSEKLKVHHYILSLEEFLKKLFPNIQEPLNRLISQDYLLIVVTNQSAINKGLISQGEYSKIVRYLKTLGVNEVYTCPHNPLKETCNCRKPRPGLLEKASIGYNIDLKHSWLIGDELIDIQAGKAAGCRTIQVLTGKIKKPVDYADYIAKDLLDAANYILLHDNT